jgi:predicted transcriptional regulator
MTVVVMQESKIRKELIQKWLDELPDEIPLEKMEEFVERVQLELRIEQGREDYRNGRVISHKEGMAKLKEKLKKWSR